MLGRSLAQFHLAQFHVHIRPDCLSNLGRRSLAQFHGLIGPQWLSNHIL